jgi:hypothetical protein
MYIVKTKLIQLINTDDGSEDFLSKHLSSSVGGKASLFGRDVGRVSGVATKWTEAEKALNVNFFPSSYPHQVIVSSRV